MNTHNLKRNINKTQLLLMSFAAIFGSGWLFAPLYAAQIAGPAALFAWVLGAIMAAIIGITMAEVVVLFPKTGGLNYIAKVTHGPFLSLSLTIFNLIVFIVLPALEVRAVLQYLTSYFKFFGTTDGGISTWGYLLAVGLLGLITMVNIYGGKVTGNLTQFTVLFKLLTPILICLFFLYTLGFVASTDFSRLSTPTQSIFDVPWALVFQAIATSGIIFSFNGFNQATIFAGEAKNPQKAIPFAILGSILAATVLYVLIQYVFLMSVPKENLSNGWAKLTFAGGDQAPFASLAGLLGLGWLLTVIYADAVVSPLGTAFAYASAAPRLLHSFIAASAPEHRLLRVNRYGVSGLLITLTLALEVLTFILLPNLKAMIALLVAAFVLCYTVAPASLLVLRKTQPDLYRPFRVRMAPFVSYASLVFSNLMVFSCGWVALRNLVCVAVILFCVYFLYHKNKKNSVLNTFKHNIVGSEWFLFQLAAVAGLSCYDAYYSLKFLYVFIGVTIISGLALWQSQRNFKKS